MAVLDKKQHILDFMERIPDPIALPDLRTILSQSTELQIPERTLRRLLSSLVTDGQLLKTGNKRSTQYQVQQTYKIASPDGEYNVRHLKFLDAVPKHRRALLLTHIRDLWTHSSTALEGNTLSLGDTHFILEEGLTIAGKPIREHQEIIGHARAIELIYRQLQTPKKRNEFVNKDFLFKLHKAVQTNQVIDIYKPNGAWKVEVNGAYARDKNNTQYFIEFAKPDVVDALMQEIIDTINSIELQKIKLVNAPAYYAKIHCGITQIHPFWDGNGRIARLVSNMLLLKAGLPPLVIDQTLRKEYIEISNRYSLTVGQLTPNKGVWPEEQALTEFVRFSAHCYQMTKDLIKNASVVE